MNNPPKSLSNIQYDYLLYKSKGLTYDEIAQKHNTSRQTVHTKIQTTLKHVAEWLKKNEDDLISTLLQSDGIRVDREKFINRFTDDERRVIRYTIVHSSYVTNWVCDENLSLFAYLNKDDFYKNIESIIYVYVDRFQEDYRLTYTNLQKKVSAIFPYINVEYLSRFMRNEYQLYTRYNIVTSKSRISYTALILKGIIDKLMDERNLNTIILNENVLNYIMEQSIACHGFKLKKKELINRYLCEKGILVEIKRNEYIPVEKIIAPSEFWEKINLLIKQSGKIRISYKSLYDMIPIELLKKTNINSEIMLQNVIAYIKPLPNEYECTKDYIYIHTGTKHIRKQLINYIIRENRIVTTKELYEEFG